MFTIYSAHKEPIYSMEGQRCFVATADDGQSEPRQGCRPDTAVGKASGDEWLNGLADTSGNSASNRVLA